MGFQIFFSSVDWLKLISVSSLLCLLLLLMPLLVGCPVHPSLLFIVFLSSSYSPFTFYCRFPLRSHSTKWKLIRTLHA